MTDYANFRSALSAIVKTLAPRHAPDGRRAMAGKLAEAAAGKAIENLAFRYRDIGHLFFPDDEAAAIELGEQISAARRTGEIASLIPDGLLPTDLLTWANCPPIRASNPLSHWLPVTEHDAPGNDAPLAPDDTAPAPPATEEAQEPSKQQRDADAQLDPAEETKDWRPRAREIADEIDAIDAKAGAYDGVRSLADRVAEQMRERNIRGTRGPLAGGSVLREALQGGRWQRKR